MPVGFKNATDGGVEVAVNAILSAARPHRFLGIDGSGHVSSIRTTGNPDCHLVLRGGTDGPNYDAETVKKAADQLETVGANSRMLVDASHDNSGKDYERQPEVVRNVASQIAEGQTSIVGVMVESNLVAGKQSMSKDRSCLCYGQSITDACVDLATTEEMLLTLASAVSRRRRKAA
jgi:3-deoxy-7-phosphoheptulonate synthase